MGLHYWVRDLKVERQAALDDSFAACFDDAGACEQVLTAEFGIAHTFSIVLKVSSFGANLFGQFRIGYRWNGGTGPILSILPSSSRLW